MSESPLLAAACAAHDTLPLYRALWPRRPLAEADIPFIGVADLHRVGGPGQLYITGADPVGAVPPLRRGRPHLAFTRIEADGDWLLRQRRLIGALSRLGPARLPHRMALVTDDATGPFAADLVELLAWSRIAASLVYAEAEPGGIDRAIEALAPDLVLLVAHVERPATDVPLVEVAHAGDRPAPATSTARLLVCDELQVLGSAGAGETAYVPADDSVRLEIDPCSGQLAVTSLAFMAAPVIRLLVGPGVALA